MFTPISRFSGKGKDTCSIVAKLDGTLLISTSSFPYFMLVAFEAGGPIRALLLLLFSPILWLLERIYLKFIVLRIMIFIAFVGLNVSDVKAVAKAVLPRFYLMDVRENAFKAFSSCGGKKYVVTSMPTVMVEAFFQEYMKVDYVVGTKLRTFAGYYLGIVAAPGLMVGKLQLEALMATPIDADQINVGICDQLEDQSFMFLCKEKYIVTVEDEALPLPRKDYPKPLIFHDGRLVARPTPLDALAVFLWAPLGAVLAILRVLIGNVLPYKLGLMACAATGLKIRANVSSRSSTYKMHTLYSRCTCELCDPGTYSPLHKSSAHTLYACSHRTLLDPVFLATVRQHTATVVTFSVSKISEILSPLRTIPLSRDRTKDGDDMRALLKQGDLVVCPEGTTCREPYLLRFSPLFAEIADVIVPVAVLVESSMFYGTTVRGYKGLDSFFFLMNPRPYYHLKFLQKVAGAGTSGESSYEVANRVQKMIGDSLGFECTTLTRRDKYRMLAGNDGVVTRTV